MTTPDEKVKELRSEIFSEVRTEAIEQGQLFPVEFVSALRMTAGATVGNLLKEHDIPTEVIQLLEDWTFLIECQEQISADCLSDINSEELYIRIPGITARIIYLGGEFHDESGSTAPRTR